jgi:hypothetical protein
MKNAMITFAITFYFPFIFSQQSTRETIYFDYGKYHLTSSACRLLENSVKKCLGKEIKQITLVGHTDGNGSRAFNDNLSGKRAETVADYFHTKGLDFAVIKTSQKGEEKPIASNHTAVGRQENRRVEILIEYTNSMIPPAFVSTFKDYKINPNRDTILALGRSGNQLHIPKDAFVDAIGNLIKAPVTLQFREYKNAAEIAFSGIPMTYHFQGEEYNFNSSGMFEITGNTAGKPVEINPKKSLEIDYKLVLQNPETHFFQLNEVSGRWTKLQEIETIQQASRKKLQTKQQDPIGNEEKTPIDSTVNFFAIRLVGDRQWIRPTKRDTPPNLEERGDFVTRIEIADATLLGEGSIDPGHTYPEIIKGLNVPSFGVYNCDQIYRVPNRVNITARYEDQDGKEITDGAVLSVIDLDYNGAFSFDPAQFTCNPDGHNALALITQSKDIYLLKKEEFAKTKILPGKTTLFILKKASEEVKTTEDLVNYLKIKM